MKMSEVWSEVRMVRWFPKNYFRWVQQFVYLGKTQINTKYSEVPEEVTDEWEIRGTTITVTYKDHTVNDWTDESEEVGLKNGYTTREKGEMWRDSTLYRRRYQSQ